MKSLNKYLIKVQTVDHTMERMGATGKVGRDMLNSMHDTTEEYKNIIPEESPSSDGWRIEREAE